MEDRTKYSSSIHVRFSISYQFITLIINFIVATLEWSEPECIGEGPSPRDAHSAVIIADNLFIFGGRNESTIYNDLHILNLSSINHQYITIIIITITIFIIY